MSLRNGTYTATLNEYGREGWELVSVTSQPLQVSTPAPEGRGLPVPRALGRIEDAAAKLNKLGGSHAKDAQPEGTSNLLWVLRRPLAEDRADSQSDS